MYSPKIPDRLIPGLYRTARSRGLPMTRLVADVLESYLASQDQDAEVRPRERRLALGGVADAPDSLPS